MAEDKFKTSLEGGNHHRLNQLAGQWAGNTKVWFEPGKIGDESSYKGTIKPILGGRFMLLEYAGSFMGKPTEGMMWIGFNIAEQKYQSAWIDTGHMGSAIMLSEGDNGPAFNVLGSYGYLGMEHRWGWRTTIELKDANTLVITAYNIEHNQPEQLALETVYTRG